MEEGKNRGELAGGLAWLG